MRLNSGKLGAPALPVISRTAVRREAIRESEGIEHDAVGGMVGIPGADEPSPIHRQPIRRTCDAEPAISVSCATNNRTRAATAAFKTRMPPHCRLDYIPEGTPTHALSMTSTPSIYVNDHVSSRMLTAAYIYGQISSASICLLFKLPSIYIAGKAAVHFGSAFSVSTRCSWSVQTNIATSEQHARSRSSSNNR